MADLEDFDRKQLQHLIEDDDMIPELDAAGQIADSETINAEETIDSGAKRLRRDDAEMAFGAEPRSIDELADAAIGRAANRRRRSRREDVEHGEGLLDPE